MRTAPDATTDDRARMQNTPHLRVSAINNTGRAVWLLEKVAVTTCDHRSVSSVGSARSYEQHQED